EQVELSRVKVTAYAFLKTILAHPIPEQGCTDVIVCPNLKTGKAEYLTISRPLEAHLENVREKRDMINWFSKIDFHSLFKFLSVQNIVRVFSSVLMERRIVIVSKNLYAVSSVTQTLIGCLHPFTWQVRRVYYYQD